MELGLHRAAAVAIASAVLLVLLIPLVWMARPAGQRAGAH